VRTGKRAARGKPRSGCDRMSPMSAPRIALDRARIAEFCRRRRIRRLALFGSVLRDDFGRDSDVDVLVEFEPGARIGWEFVTIRDELAELFGRAVDLLTPSSIQPAFRDAILSSVEEVYVSA
jgi:predicted nucleotidyltransferase